MLVVSVVALPAGAGGGPATAPLAPEDGALFGAAAAPGTKDDPFQPLAELETKLGRRVAIDRYDRPFGTVFPDSGEDGREQTDIASGRIPMIAWGPVATGEVNRGSWDNQVRLRARSVRALGQPVLIAWFPDMTNAHNAIVAGEPAQYVAAWRRIRRIFIEEEARNAVWVWCAGADIFASGSADAWYPGDGDVDWTCAEGYNPRHPERPETVARSFEEIFTPFHQWAAEHDRPMMVGRWGAVEDGPGVKAAWVDAARDALQGPLSGIDAVVYDSTVAPAPHSDAPSDDRRMDSSEESMAAFAAMADEPWFKPAVEATLPDTVIDSGPEKIAGSGDVTFNFSATGKAKVTGFECHLDRARWQACASPFALTGLPDGRHTFEVRALGAAGRTDPTAAKWDWTVDTTGPTVTATSPKDGATDFSPGEELTATFSEAIDPATVVAETFILVAEATGQVVSGKVTYDPATRKARLRPEQALLPLAAYRATVTAGVKDRVGNAMADDHSWSFQTNTDTSRPEPPNGPETPPGAPKPPAAPKPPGGPPNR
jgi:hypothetical protein